MDTILISIVLILCVINLIMFFNMKGNNNSEIKKQLNNIENATNKIEKTIQYEISRFREENNSNARNIREEVSYSLNQSSKSITNQMSTIANLQNNQLQNFSEQLSKLTDSNEQRLNDMRNTIEQKLLIIPFSSQKTRQPFFLRPPLPKTMWQ